MGWARIRNGQAQYPGHPWACGANSLRTCFWISNVNLFAASNGLLFHRKNGFTGKKPADKSHQPQLPLVLRTSFRVLHVTPGPSACFPGTTPSPCGYELAPTKKHSSSLKTSFLRTGPKRPQRHEHPPLSVWALGCFLLFFFFLIFIITVCT